MLGLHEPERGAMVSVIYPENIVFIRLEAPAEHASSMRLVIPVSSVFPFRTCGNPTNVVAYPLPINAFMGPGTLGVSGLFVKKSMETRDRFPHV
ncbi:MAG: hypothetical protein AMXMBFR16_09310 [Candidatus Uhrbacteria bacterium]|nr:MAG: hypothetical protein DCC77_04490 [Candidatus Uhrbacteria bacterium]